MNEQIQQLHDLMEDTLQILDHMIVDPKYERMHTDIINGLTAQKNYFAQVNNPTQESLGAMIDLLMKMKEVARYLEGDLLDDYKKATGNAIAQYEQMSLTDQMEQTETYHDKIDYLSAVKVKKNFSKMIELLNSLGNG